MTSPNELNEEMATKILITPCAETIGGPCDCSEKAAARGYLLRVSQEKDLIEAADRMASQAELVCSSVSLDTIRDEVRTLIQDLFEYRAARAKLDGKSPIGEGE